MYIKENSPVKDSNMNYQEQKYYQQGKIDGIREFVRELKKHSCSYDLEELMDFDGNILSGEIPYKQNQLVKAWILIHKEELESLWRLLQDESDYFKIEPLK